MAIGTNCNAARAKNSIKDPVNGKRQQALVTVEVGITSLITNEDSHVVDRFGRVTDENSAHLSDGYLHLTCNLARCL